MQEPKTLAQAIRYFGDADNCLKYLMARRWPKGVTCPTCGREDVVFVPSRRLWQCKTRHPKAQFSIKIGTIMEDSPLGLDKWLPVMWMVANCKNGVSSWEIHRSLGVAQKTAWFMLHRIRLGMQDTPTPLTPKMGGQGGEVEVDETFIGGKLGNMHPAKQARLRAVIQRSARFGGTNGKTVVMGMLDRNAKQIRAKVVPDVSRQTLQNAVLQNVTYGTNVYTDQAPAYQRLNQKYLHEIVNHAETYVRGKVHTNGLENFWSLLKRNLSGTYVCVEPFHLGRYVDEQVFRFNNRGSKEFPVNDGERFSRLCSQIVGKRLTYAELTARDKKQDVPF